MAVNVLKLKKQAVDLGMSKAEAMKATRAELEKFVSTAGKPTKKTSKKTAAKPVVKKKTGKRVAPAKKTPTKKAPAKRNPPAAKKTGKAATKKATGNSDVGRAAIGSLDWSIVSEDWNPRPGGPTERMFKALKKAKGDVAKAFEALKDDVYEFVGRTKRDGTRRTKQEALEMLKYRLNRTKFEYGVRTGQHHVATNRKEYGTGDYASKKSGRSKVKREKAAPVRKPARKAPTKVTGRKRGRPKGSKNKVKR